MLLYIRLKSLFVNQDRQARETRQKIDQFFARIHQPTPPKPSAIHIPVNTVTIKTQEPQDEHQSPNYKRAAPWPVEVWCR